VKTGEPSNRGAIDGRLPEQPSYPPGRDPSPDPCGRDNYVRAAMLLELLPVAHTGHVIVDLLTFSPVLVLIVWFAVISIRDRRRGPDRDTDGHTHR
jgi:hypothetical protein